MRPVRTLRTARILAASALMMCSGQEVTRGGRALRPNEVPVQVTYNNAEYAYGVPIPEGLVGYRMKPPAPQHGFVIGLDEGEVWVNGEYDAADVGSLEALGAKTAAEWVASGQLKLVRSTPTTLALIPAREIVLERERADGQINYVHVVTAIRVVPRGVGIVYTLGLRARNATAADEKVFSAVVRSFRLIALPK